MKIKFKWGHPVLVLCHYKDSMGSNPRPLSQSLDFGISVGQSRDSALYDFIW